MISNVAFLKCFLKTVVPLFWIQMTQADFKLRAILIDIDRQLTNSERKTLGFLIGSDDVPRQLIDTIEKDDSTSMIPIWEALLDRRKIDVDNVNYLIERLKKIERTDLVQKLIDYCDISLSLSKVPVK
jgi:hypothetical protein